MIKGRISWTADRPRRDVNTIAAAVAVITGFAARLMTIAPPPDEDGNTITTLYYFDEPRQSARIITLWECNGLINIKVCPTYPDCDKITADVRDFITSYSQNFSNRMRLAWLEAREREIKQEANE